jgi:hypothetical protein
LRPNWMRPSIAGLVTAMAAEQRQEAYAFAVV